MNRLMWKLLPAPVSGGFIGQNSVVLLWYFQPFYLSRYSIHAGLRDILWFPVPLLGTIHYFFIISRQIATSSSSSIAICVVFPQLDPYKPINAALIIAGGMRGYPGDGGKTVYQKVNEKRAALRT